MQAQTLPHSLLCLVFRAQALNTVGVFNGEGPPVPIPNTEVKLTGAENTCLATDREDRSMPTQKRSHPYGWLLFCFFIVHEEGPLPLLELLPLLCGRKRALLVEDGSFCVSSLYTRTRFAEGKRIFPFRRVTTREVSIFSLLVQGQEDMSLCRFSQADLHRLFVAALENTKVLSAVCASIRRKSAL